MRLSVPLLLGIMTVFGPAGWVSAGVEYHFMPGVQGQSRGSSQFVDFAPVAGPQDFKVLLSGSVIGSVPSLDEQSAHAYLDKWGMGVRDPQVGEDTGVVGQVLLNGGNGGEYLRLEFPDPVRLTYLTFASVGLADRFELVADGSPVDLLALFPGTATIRDISNVQGNWPGTVDFRQAAQPLVYATVWDVMASSSSFGSGIQLENVGCDVIAEPSAIVPWLIAFAAVAALGARRRWQGSR